MPAFDLTNGPAALSRFDVLAEHSNNLSGFVGMLRS